MSMQPPPPPGPPTPPPPPPGGASQPAASGGFDIGQGFSWSFTQIQKNAAVLLILGGIVFGIQLAVRVISSAASGGFSFNPASRSAGTGFAALLVFSVILPIVGLIAVSLVQLGLIRVSLELTRGNKISVGEAFQTTSWGSYILAAILNGLAIFVGVLLCCVGALVPIVMFAFFGYFIVDQQQGPTNGLGSSWNLVKSRLGDVILLLLCVFGITLVVSYVTCGIGSIFTYPFAALLLAYAYRTLRGEGVAAAA